MSHISKLKTDIQFKDTAVLSETLNALGKVLEGINAKTVMLNEGNIKSLTFIKLGYSASFLPGCKNIQSRFS